MQRAECEREGEWSAELRLCLVSANQLREGCVCLNRLTAANPRTARSEADAGGTQHKQGIEAEDDGVEREVRATL